MSTEALLPFPVEAEGPELPIARVLVDSPLPHLDRLFDYLVPAELADAAQPGVRVKVRFAGRELNGFLVARTAQPSTSHRLSVLGKVVSSVQVLTPEVLQLSQEVAARYVGAVSDVLRVAIPARMAKMEQGFVTDAEAVEMMPFTPDPTPFSGYDRAAPFLDHLAAGGSPRAVLTSVKGYGKTAWQHQIAQAIAVCSLSGRGAIAVVPDQRDLDRLCAAVSELLGPESFVRLSAEEGPTPRYRGFLKLLSGERRIALGARSAAFAPVRDLGLLCAWDDGDDLLIERRAPYQHAREVLLLRAEQQQTALLLAGHSRSVEAQRLVDSGWARSISPQRTVLRTAAPRVVSTSDSFELERDPLAALARLPHRAWLTAQEGLQRGPVLVQVARGGYAPALACGRCREAARCKNCQGPLAQATSASSAVRCTWCGTPDNDFRCRHCGGAQLRRTVAGAGRTAEELGRAFPKFTVISSAGDHVKDTVPDKPALVVATIGAEPVAEQGYAAALLLDGDAMMRRENLRAAEEAARRWFNAAALVRPAEEDGVVVLTAAQSEAAAALVRWDPAGFAERELALRKELALPPAVRLIAITGPLNSVREFTARLELAAEVRCIGPALLENGGEDYRTLLFVPYALAAGVLAQVRAVKMSLSAARQSDPVQIRCDGLDLL